MTQIVNIKMSQTETSPIGHLIEQGIGENKMSKKKIIIISICVIVVLIILGVAIYFISKNIEASANENKLSKMYNKMMENKTYTISFKLDDNNQNTISRNGNMANIDTYSNGKHTTTIIRDGNTHLLLYDTKKFYTYQNNDIELEELPNSLNKILQSQEPTKGEEEVNGTMYKYEEYKGVNSFLMNADDETSEGNISTKFYFKGDNLKYIKTIMGDTSELLEINLSYGTDNKAFEIPTDFQEG